MISISREGFSQFLYELFFPFFLSYSLPCSPLLFLQAFCVLFNFASFFLMGGVVPTQISFEIGFGMRDFLSSYFFIFKLFYAL